MGEPTWAASNKTSNKLVLKLVEPARSPTQTQAAKADKTGSQDNPDASD